MKFGVCCGFEMAELLEKIGFDYIEGNVTVISSMTDGEFNAVAEKMDSLKIRCEASCCLFPGKLKVVGPHADMGKIADYLDRAFARLERLGVESVVFGSGGARRVPEGFDRARAWHQLIQVGRMLSDKAGEHGLKIALEPLNRGETNIINSQREGLALVADVDRPNFLILTDLYHVYLENDTREDIDACKGLLQHCHVVNPVGRICMTEADNVPYDMFFGGIADCGYTGRISFEGIIDNAEEELPRSLATMKAFAEKYGI